MEVLYPRCAGIDVHQATLWTCVMTSGGGAEPKREIRQHSTVTAELMQLRQWLIDNKVTHVAMESTGVYWKPVFNILEGACEVILVNARHIKQVPGRKTDQADCAWIASLLRHGLLRASFVPPLEVRQLRDLCRARTTLVRECVQTGNRLRKVLEDANIKLSSVASNALGVSGRSMIQALINGVTDPVELASLARGRLKSKREPLTLALDGRLTPHHRFLLERLMKQLEFLEQEIDRFEAEIGNQIAPFEPQVELLMTVPGIDRTSACALVAELGAEMSPFPSPRHLASWAGLCPGNNESAGKSRSGRSHRGSPWIKGLMTEVAWAATKTKNTYCSTQYKKLAARRGKKRALVAVANGLIQSIWHILTTHRPYHDLGPDYLDKLHAKDLERSLVRRLEKLGHKVTLQPAA
jgi:transposase